jgi:hypothetical protein
MRRGEARPLPLDLSRWVGKAVDDGLTADQALAELRGRPVPWPEGNGRQASIGKPVRSRAKMPPRA